MRIPPEVLKRILPRLSVPGVTSESLGPAGSRKRSLVPRRFVAPDLPALEVRPRLTLRAEQVLLGRIVRVAPGGAILDVDGTRVRASIRTPMRLSAGDRLWLQAEATTTGRGLPLLRVLGTVEQTVPLEAFASDAPDVDAAASLLRASRLPVTPTSRAIVEQIVRLGLPFSSASVGELVRVADAVTDHSPTGREAAVRAALLAHDRGLPPTEQVVRSLANVLAGPALADLVEQLAREVRRYLPPAETASPQAVERSTVPPGQASAEARTPAAPHPAPLAAEATTYRRLLGQLDALTRSASLAVAASPAEAPRATLDELFQRLGLNYEFRLETSVSRLNLTGRLDGATGDGVPGSTADEGRSEQLKPSLLHILRQEGLPDGIRARATALLDHITGRQLLLRPYEGEPLTSVMVPLPVGDEGRRQWLTVWGRFRHDDSERGKSASPKLDLQNCRIVFDLQLPKLGRTVVDVHVVNRTMQVEVMTAYREVEDLLRTQRKELEKALTEYGFRLSGLESSPLPERAVPSGSPIDEAPSETFRRSAASPAGGVNLKI